MKYRIRYAKTGTARFISHLDFQRAFQRALRRTNLNIAFSEGYNPHPLMSYSQPLPLFAESEAEYTDLALSGGETPQEVFYTLNEVMPEGIQIKSVVELNSPYESLSKCFSSADWLCELAAAEGSDAGSEAEAVNALFASEEPLEIEKKNKKKQLVKKDIRERVNSLRAFADGEVLSITAELCVSDGAVLNPYELLTALRSKIPALAQYRVRKVYKTAMN